MARNAALAALLACTLACSPAQAAPARSSLSALDLIELEISYTTLLARYYRPLAPRTLVDGARTGIAAELVARGIPDAVLPYTPARVDFAGGADLIDALVLRSLARYGARLDGHALVAAAVAGELGAVHDPYTVVFRPTAFRRFNAFLGNATFGGIGAIVSLDAQAGRAPIERTLAGGPAAEAGLRGGDAILAIDGKSARAFANGPALLAALRGTIGTTVALDVAKADGTTQQVRLVRAAVRDPEVESKRFGATGYLRLTRFGDRAGAETAAALADLERAGARAVVLDLRGNGGGYGDEATSVASVFIRSGPIYTTLERGLAPVVARASGTSTFAAPLVVLVDGDTASAAEIVAGAIQDDGIGTLLGATTFGKGLVQRVFALPDGSALKVTTARYVTPRGRDIDRVGIRPDVPVVQPPGSVAGDPATDPQLAAALARLAADPGR